MSLRRKFLSLLLIPVLLTTVVRAADGEKSLSDYWREVALPFSLIEKRLTVSSCYESATHFQGCVEAINAILDESEPPLVLVPHTTRSESPDRQDFGSVKVRESRESSNEGLPEDIQHERDLMDKRHRAWLALFNEGRGKVDFSVIARWMKQELLTPDRESELTAAALDGYFTTLKDPHTGLMPDHYFSGSPEGRGTQFLRGRAYLSLFQARDCRAASAAAWRRRAGRHQRQ